MHGKIGFLVAASAAIGLLTSVPTILGQERATSTAETGLVAWWPFDAQEGGKTADKASPAHLGILEGGAKIVPGRVGNAVLLDGKAACVSVPGFKGVTGTQARTIAVWIKTAKPSGQIVSWGTNEPGRMWIFGFIRGRIGVSPRGGYLYVKEELHDDQWHHVAVVMEAGSPPNLHDRVKLFVEGKPAEIHDIGLLDLWPIDTGEEADVVIGRGFSGLIDELRIYDRALTEAEICSLSQAKE